MPEAIADSSVLILLAGIDRIGLLERYHRRVMVSPAVVREVVEEGKGQPGSAELQSAIDDGWISVRQPADRALVTTLQRDLGDGEAESIALGTELPDAVVLLDDSDARSRARALGLETAGVVGLLIRARKDGTIDSLSRELERLRTEMGFWISEDLVKQALAEVGESQ